MDHQTGLASEAAPAVRGEINHGQRGDKRGRDPGRVLSSQEERAEGDSSPGSCRAGLCPPGCS